MAISRGGKNTLNYPLSHVSCILSPVLALIVLKRAGYRMLEIRAVTIKALLVSGDSRFILMPSVPATTIIESGDDSKKAEPSASIFER